jgi:hypothetical protein
MRRLCAFATFVSLAFALPLFAQHGGGHASSGGGHGGSFSGHSGFSGGHSSFSAPGSNHAYSGMGSRAGYGAHSASGARSYAGSMGGSMARSRAFQRPQQAFSANRNASANRFGFANRIDGARFRNRNRGFAGPWRFGYPGWYGYYNPYFYDPYWLWDSSSYYDDSQDQQDQDVAKGYEMNGPGPEEQGAPDSYGENYNGGGDQDAYAQSAPYEPRHAELTAPSAPTTLIFRDQHKEEIQNYAIVGNMLFSFSAERTQKIPLSDLDIPATTKVNEDRGVNFRIPGEGQ